MSEQTYVGSELELFAQAHHWKSYWISQLRRFIRGSVLEVGAGIGTNTLLLRNGAEARWLCLEPDPKLVAVLKTSLASHSASRPLEVRPGTIALLGPEEKFDTVLYIDVLEHIEEDRRELETAANHLGPGGRLVVLAPAHSWLFSAFDQSIGHYRRYTVEDLESLTPSKLRRANSFYLDSIGLLASAANRFLLRQAMPNARQLRCWDRWMVPCSRILDPITGYRWGKSVVCVWERNS